MFKGRRFGLQSSAQHQSGRLCETNGCHLVEQLGTEAGWEITSSGTFVFMQSFYSVSKLCSKVERLPQV